jgi:hypothetical protein
MKKVLLPLLMLIVASSFLMAVESAPSAIVGYVKYPCVTGLNLVSFPMAPGFANLDEFSTAMNGNITTVNKWVADGQYWNASDYDEMFGWSQDFSFIPGESAYIYSSADFNCYSMGPVPAPSSYDVLVGLNLIMVPLNRSDITTMAGFGDAFGGAVTTVNTWINVGQYWGTTDYDEMFGWSDPDTPASIGEPFYLYSNAAMTWPSAKGITKSKLSTSRTK